MKGNYVLLLPLHPKTFLGTKHLILCLISLKNPRESEGEDEEGSMEVWEDGGPMNDPRPNP